MASWVYANDSEILQLQSEVDRFETEKTNTKTDDKEEKKTTWTLNVEYSEPMNCNEHLGVTGNLDKMGNWQADDVMVMTRVCDNKHTVDIRVPHGTEIFYRYVVCMWNPLVDSYTIICWESHTKPRNVRDRHKKVEKFGWQKQDYKVSRAWVCPGEVFVHFQLFNAPFYWPKTKKGKMMPKQLLYVKLNPICATDIQDIEDDPITTQQSISCKKKDFSRCYALNLALMKNESTTQGEYGMRCGPKDLISYDMTIKQQCLTLYRFDVYTYGSCDRTKDSPPPCYYGYGYVEPDEMVDSLGYIKLRINAATTGKLRLLAKLRYQLIRPCENLRFTMERTFQTYWNYRKETILIGHRGCGYSFQHETNFIRENTPFSLQRAGNYGASMVEFDVMLTKDAIPIVCHDPVLRMPIEPEEPFSKMLKERDVLVFPADLFDLEELVRRMGCIENGTMFFPLAAFTAEELQRFKVYRFEGDANDKCRKYTCTQMFHEQMPFARLEQVLTELCPSLGFNIEVKYTQKNANDAWENDGFKPAFDLNFYIDKILEVVFKYAGTRRIIFSSFSCAACLALRYKQNMYPVLLLHMCPNAMVQCKDPRVVQFRNAVFTCKAMELSGIVLNTNTILKQPEAVNCIKMLGMIVLSWGSLNNKEDIRIKLNDFGVHGIIFDRIDQLENVVQAKPTLCKLETCENKDYLACIQKAEIKKKCIS